MNHLDYEPILQFLRVEDPGVKAARLAGYSPADWEALLVQALQLGVAPLVAWGIKKLAPPVAPPEDVRRELRQSLLAGAARNLRLFNELEKVLRQLELAGIPVILLKGAHLAAFVYEDIGLRSMCDIDLLVQPQDLERCSQVLTELGYQSGASLLNANDLQSVHHHLPAFEKSDVPPLEIHWSIVKPQSPFKIDRCELWRRAQQVEIAGSHPHILSPQNLIIHLCVHAFEDRYQNGLRPFLDLIEAINYYQDAIDWDQIQQKARRWNVTKCVYLMLYLSRLLLNAPPEPILALFTPADFNSQLADELLGNVFEGPNHSRNFIQLWGDRGVLNKIRLIWKRVFLPPAKMAYLYNISPQSVLVYGFYLLRLKELIFRYGRLSGQNFILNDLKSSAQLETDLVEWLACPLSAD